jgi:hypothetical protein
VEYVDNMVNGREGRGSGEKRKRTFIALSLVIHSVWEKGWVSEAAAIEAAVASMLVAVVVRGRATAPVATLATRRMVELRIFAY